MSTFSTKTRDIVAGRSGGLCEHCREARAQHHHHRMAKGMGGNRSPHVQSPANDAHVCHTCHADIHAHPADSYESGWLIRRSGDVDPEQIPLEDLKGGRFFLTSDGGKLDRHHFYGTPNPPPF